MKRENAIVYEIYTRQNTSILLALLTVFFLIVSMTGCASDDPAQSGGEITGTVSSCAGTTGRTHFRHFGARIISRL